MKGLEPKFSLMPHEKDKKTPEEIATLAREIRNANLRMRENGVTAESANMININNDKTILRDLESLEIEFSALDMLKASLSENPDEFTKNILESKMKDVADSIKDIEKRIKENSQDEVGDRLDVLKARLSLLEFGNPTKKTSDEEAA